MNTKRTSKINQISSHCPGIFWLFWLLALRLRWTVCCSTRALAFDSQVSEEVRIPRSCICLTWTTWLVHIKIIKKRLSTGSTVACIRWLLAHETEAAWLLGCLCLALLLLTLARSSKLRRLECQGIKCCIARLLLLLRIHEGKACTWLARIRSWIGVKAHVVTSSILRQRSA